MVWLALIIRFCSSRVSTRSVFHISPRSDSCTENTVMQTGPPSLCYIASSLPAAQTTQWCRQVYKVRVLYGTHSASSANNSQMSTTPPGPWIRKKWPKKWSVFQLKAKQTKKKWQQIFLLFVCNLPCPSGSNHGNKPSIPSKTVHAPLSQYIFWVLGKL